MNETRDLDVEKKKWDKKILVNNIVVSQSMSILLNQHSSEKGIYFKKNYDNTN